MLIITFPLQRDSGARAARILIFFVAWGLAYGGTVRLNARKALFGPILIEILARVAARMGEPDRAIAALQKLLSISYAGAFSASPLTPALLRLDPMFDSLRNDPRFQNSSPRPRRKRPTDNAAERRSQV